MNTFERKQRLCADAYEIAKEDPHVIKEVISNMTRGVEDALTEERKARGDMEVLASVAMQMAMGKGRISAKTRQAFEDLALSKLQKYLPDKSMCNWSWAVENKEMG